MIIYIVIPRLRMILAEGAVVIADLQAESQSCPYIEYTSWMVLYISIEQAQF